MADVQVPSKAVSEGTDLKQPIRALLEDLNLLGTPEETEAAGKFGAAFKGPAQSVALIEAGATAAGKWWASGLSVTVLAAWTSVATWFRNETGDVRVATLLGAALVTAAAILAIGYLIASDVRGRAAASVATIEARAVVAQTMIESAKGLYKPPSPPPSPIPAPKLVPLPSPLMVRNHDEEGEAENGWRAVAMLRDSDGTLKYVVIKGSAEATVAIDRLTFL